MTAVLCTDCMLNIYRSPRTACCLTCGDDGIDDLQDCAHEVSIHSMLSSKLPRRCQGGGDQVWGAQWGAHGRPSIQGATAAPSAYSLIPVRGNAQGCQVILPWFPHHLAKPVLPGKSSTRPLMSCGDWECNAQSPSCKRKHERSVFGKDNSKKGGTRQGTEAS